MLAKNKQKSPLTYPNDKPRAGTLVSSYIPKGVSKLVMPFLGGGSLELSLAAKGYGVTGCTDFRLLYDFWDCVRRDPEKIYQMAMGFYPIENPKLFYMLQKKVYQPHDEYLRSALFYILTLCADGCSATSGNIEEGTPRFNHLRLMQLSKYECDNFKVLFKNYKEAIEETSDFLVCVPPPFMIANFANAVTIPERPQIDHKKLSLLLAKRKNWIILYNYHKGLWKLYPDNQILMIDEASRVTQQEGKAVEALILGS